MAWPNNDCTCVQGIEQFIDPRLYLPTMESAGNDGIELPIWDQKLLDAADKLEKELAEKEESRNVCIDPERVIKLVAQRTHLINQGYVQLTAYQIKSFYIQVDSLDVNWRNANVTLLFSHSNGLKSIPVPVLELGKPVLIPSAVLVPGTLRVAAMATEKVNDYSVITTNSIEFQIYDPQIKPVAWPKMRDYDIYFMYQTLAKNLIAEVKAIKDSTPIKLVGTINAQLKDVTVDDEILDPVEVVYSVTYDKYSVNYNVHDFVVNGLYPTHEYTIAFELPNKVLGLTNITPEEYARKAEDLTKYLFVDGISMIHWLNFPDIVEKVEANLENLPRIVIRIPAGTEITTLKVAIKDLDFDRDVEINRES